MKIIANVFLLFKSHNHLDIAFKALKPEIESTSLVRSKVNMDIKDNYLILKIEATDIVALRATINTYLRWLLAIDEIYNLLENK
jgi:tRNA threonylcarbamoyladenosine modification (KEOPS) complex  Pcc1 subunit